LEENVSLNFIVFLVTKKIFSKKFIDSWNKAKYCNKMYSTYFSWNGFLPMSCCKSDSEIYLCMVKSKAKDYTQANFALGHIFCTMHCDIYSVLNLAMLHFCA
jgi:hypothetical protein